MNRLWPALLFLLSLCFAGCGGGSGQSIRHQGRPAGIVQMPLSGVYRATIVPPFEFMGPISARISAEPTDKNNTRGFVASTRPNVAWDMIGGVQGFLGPLFVPYIFPGGTIATWKSTIPAGDTPGEGWFGIGGIKNAGVKTRVRSSDSPVELLVRDGRRAGLLLLGPDSPDSPPLRDYPALAESIAAIVQEHAFDPAAPGTSAIRSYLSQVRSSSKLARDDIEFIFGIVAAARNHVKFTMPIAFPKGDAASRREMKGWDAAEITPLRATFDEKTRIAWLRVDAFIDAHDVDRAFEKILSFNPVGIMIDLRSSPGVTLASLRTISWIANEPIDAGMWIGSKRRKEVLEDPSKAQRLELSSASSVEDIEHALDRAGAGRILVKPDPRAFTGRVAVLTTRRTSASAEPLAWALKSSQRARSFGQPTLGKPYLPRPYDIGQNWVYWLAAFDYRTAAGEAIPESGLKPDVELSSRESAARAAEKYLLEGTGIEIPKDRRDDGGDNPISPITDFYRKSREKK